ncbi:hypothetical protein M413DRAFT_13392 [Hebeloma cylindrosporum]|uniref:Uncharacterized protein n=1 Tax=Hebeloma cylindrosporum TaxID=76867 RepID=A0A0C3C188_HEBCY|nr:hypothetical protein M413DRAFT_13392 [Hebeloma cylindrosporum h7]
MSSPRQKSRNTLNVGSHYTASLAGHWPGKVEPWEMDVLHALTANILTSHVALYPEDFAELEQIRWITSVASKHGAQKQGWRLWLLSDDFLLPWTFEELVYPLDDTTFPSLPVNPPYRVTKFCQWFERLDKACRSSCSYLNYAQKTARDAAHLGFGIYGLLVWMRVHIEDHSFLYVFTKRDVLEALMEWVPTDDDLHNVDREMLDLITSLANQHFNGTP